MSKFECRTTNDEGGRTNEEVRMTKFEEKGKRPERIHDIVKLINKATNLGFASGLSMDEAVFLNSIYKGRYPTEEGLLPHGEPTHEDANKVISAARKLMENLRAQK